MLTRAGRRVCADSFGTSRQAIPATAVLTAELRERFARFAGEYRDRAEARHTDQP